MYSVYSGAQLTGPQLAAFGLTAGAVIIAGLATLDDEVRELGHVANHLGIAGLDDQAPA
jgi:hypothetical protein